LPVGFTPDEASFGYDAYSLLRTGKDQWGHKFPLVLESFGDYKLPLYAYLTIPSVFLFGLNKYAVRLPNALLGTFAVYITYLLVIELFKDYFPRKNKNTSYSSILANIAAFLLAVSSWHIMLSRGAFEANLTSFFMPLGVLFFLKAIRNRNFFLILSSLVFGLNLFSYHSARLVTPLIFLLLVFLFRKNILRISLKVRIYSTAIFLIFVLMAFYTLYIGAARRAKDISIFSGILQEASDQRLISILSGVNPKTARLLHNKYQVLAQRFVQNYLQYFSPNFLFVDGPKEATYGMLPQRGVLYWFELPFLLSFLYFLCRNARKREALFIACWLIIAPIPAALTQGEGYAANRASAMIPAIHIALALGAFTFWQLISGFLKNQKLTKALFFVYSFFTLLILIYFIEDYFFLSPLKAAKAMLYGNLEAAYWLKEKGREKNEIVVSTSLSEPHIFIAFANIWDPNDYQIYTKNWRKYKEQNLTFLDQLPFYNLGKYTFRRIDYSQDQKLTNSFLVGKLDEFPSSVNPVKQFGNFSEKPFVVIVEPKSQVYAFKNF